MNQKEVKATIEKAFSALDGECGTLSWEAQRLLNGALQAAIEGERRQRKGRSGNYKQSVVTAAKYFVVKWYQQTSPAKRITFRDAASMRQDALFAGALRQLLDAADRFPLVKAGVPQGVADIDYLRDITP